MLKRKLWRIDCNTSKWTVGVRELWLSFVVMLCSTALLLAVMNLAIASCGCGCLWMDCFGWLWFIVRELCSYLLLLAPCANRRCKIPMRKARCRPNLKSLVCKEVSVDCFVNYCGRFSRIRMTASFLVSNSEVSTPGRRASSPNTRSGRRVSAKGRDDGDAKSCDSLSVNASWHCLLQGCKMPKICSFFAFAGD